MSAPTNTVGLLTSVFFVDAGALGRWERMGSVAAAERWLADLGLPQGMPFVLGADGSSDRVANGWLASLLTHGCRSWSTWSAYALNWAEWARFLHARDLLGHASVTTTQVYLHAIDPTRLLASVDEEFEECRAA